MSVELLRRAWNALDTFKQAYPENWHEEDQQVLDDLIAADLDLSGVERKWQGLTDEEKDELIRRWAGELVFEVEQSLKEKNV